MYRVLIDGEVKAVSDITPFWRDDNVTFYLGKCATLVAFAVMVGNKSRD